MERESNYMDFMSRNGQQAGNRVAPASPGNANAPVGPRHDGSKKSFSSAPKWLRVVNVVLLFSMTVLAIAVAWFIYSYNPSEAKYVAKDKYQAVFLSNGQVYFGKVAAVTPRYIDLRNIFYLNTQSQTEQAQATSQNSKFTLIKLGCELHQPYDQMIINQDQVTFWENLNDDGQVVKNIDTWYEQNPNGQNCDEAAANNANQTTNSTTNNSTTTKKQ